jgi:hypothetical protein
MLGYRGGEGSARNRLGSASTKRVAQIRHHILAEKKTDKRVMLNPRGQMLNFKLVRRYSLDVMH